MKRAFCIFLLAGACFTRSASAETLGDRCKATGDHALCGPAGAPLEASSPDTAMDLYTAECTKHPNDCFSLVAFGQRALKKKDGARAQQIFERGCELKAWRACASLASELEEGERGIPQDVTRAARYHNAACDLGSARDCVLLAVMTEDGRGVRRDARAAARLRARAEQLDKPAAPRPASAPVDDSGCRKGQDAMRCFSAGNALADTDAVKAEELYRLGCGIDRATCGLWGFAIERLRRDDPSRATRILDEGCTSGTGLACYVLGELNHTGYRSVPRNETHAAELYDKACSAGEAAGCRVIAARYRGVKDNAKADELRAKAYALEADADKPLAALQEAWLKEAAQSGAREPYARELDRKRVEWRALEARARARWDLRMQRLAEIDAGNQPAALPAAPATDATESTSREGAINRMAKALFP